MFNSDNFWLKTLQIERYKKFYYVTGSLLVLSLFGDTILLFIGHCLHVMFEFIATIFEHWLQSAFNLSERQAQIVFFYIFTFGFVWFVWWFGKKIYVQIKRFCHNTHSNLCLIVNEINWYKVAAYMTVFSTSVFLLT